MAPRTKKTFGTDDVLLILCKSVTKVLSEATGSRINYSPVVQRITKTSLKPEIGCFVLFDGVFSGIVIMNFGADSAMEIYGSYMRQMGMPDEELATRHSSDEVGNTLGELMNQIVGEFTASIEHELMVSVTQSQPKMIAINKEVVLSINANLDSPQARKVAFQTQERHPFYIEMAMEKTTFMQLEDFERGERQGVDDILADAQNKKPEAAPAQADNNDDLLDSLGI
jgi:chemotaxis protein CheY-P-specific phosphatase CheC